MVLCAIAFILSLSIANVQANPTGTAGSVSSAWAGQNPTDYTGVVPLGSTVHIYWTGVQNPTTGTVVITVIDPNGAFVTNFAGHAWGPSDSGTPSFTASMVGNYYIVFDGWPSYHLFTTVVAGISVFVVPESVFGTLAAVGAGFAAFATVNIYRKRKEA